MNPVPMVRVLGLERCNHHGRGCRSYLRTIKALEVCQYEWAVPVFARSPMTNGS